MKLDALRPECGDNKVAWDYRRPASPMRAPATLRNAVLPEL